jgi:hypothetical protein
VWQLSHVHGSTNPRFLRVSQVNLLCLQCHTFPFKVPPDLPHNQSTKYQACNVPRSDPQVNASNVFFR